jgi:hypothetical protein
MVCRRTLLREAELKLVDRGEFLDALVVLEEGTRHFYARAAQLKSMNAKPEEVDASLLKAVDIAAKIAPYRHHRLAAIKLNKDPVDPALREEASLEELRIEMQKALGEVSPGSRSGSVDCTQRRHCQSGGARGMTWHNFQSVLLTLIGPGCVAAKCGTVWTATPIDTETAGVPVPKPPNPGSYCRPDRNAKST